MGSLFDVAVIGVAVLVCISLVALAWTLGVSITGVLRRTRASLVNARLDMAVAERRLRSTAREVAEARAEARVEARVEATSVGEGDG